MPRSCPEIQSPSTYNSPPPDICLDLLLHGSSGGRTRSTTHRLTSQSSNDFQLDKPSSKASNSNDDQMTAPNSIPSASLGLLMLTYGKAKGFALSPPCENDGREVVPGTVGNSSSASDAVVRLARRTSLKRASIVKMPSPFSLYCKGKIPIPQTRHLSKLLNAS